VRRSKRGREREGQGQRGGVVGQRGKMVRGETCGGEEEHNRYLILLPFGYLQSKH
jgi:hypothetical protein